MLKSKITRENLKDIGAEFLFENKCQPYAEGVNSAWDVFNIILSAVETQDAELKILRELVLAYSKKDKAPNHAEEIFQKGKIDFYEYVLNYEDVENLKKENENLKKEVEYLKERIKFWENSSVKSQIRCFRF